MSPDSTDGHAGRRSTVLGIVLLGLVDVLLFADVLRPGITEVPTAWDVEIHGRLLQFAAAELRRGHLPLWNPHVFSGMPGLGNPNAMMLYPPSLLGVALPLPLAITLGVVMHTFLAGVSMFLWTRRRGLHAAGCLLAAAMVSFGGPYFARIHAGHLSVLAALAWTPLLLLAVDEILRRPSATWVGIGAVTVAMQALGGHPQFVFYSLLAAGLTLVLRLREAGRPWQAVAAFVATVGGGLCLAAIQLFPVFDALGEASRGAALGQGSAAAFSMTWSALLMLLVPNVFGHGTPGPYWGDWLYWEITPFVGIVGLALAIYGATHGGRSKRGGATILACIFFLLALGANTPLFHLLYDFVPPFDRFRASARAVFYFGLFIALLAAVGVDTLMRDPRRSRALVAGLVVVAVLLATASGGIALGVSGDPPAARNAIEAMLRMPPRARDARIRELAGGSAAREAALRAAASARDRVKRRTGPRAKAPAPEDYAPEYVEAMKVDAWQALRAFLVRTPGYGHSLRDWADPARGRAQAHAAILQLLVSAALCVVVAVFFHVAPRRRSAALVLAVIGFLEMCTFAWSIRETFDLSKLCPSRLDVFYRAAGLREAPDAYRVHDATNANCAMAAGVLDIWGYDSFVSARYKDYMAFTHERVDGDAIPDVARRGAHRSYGMLRLRYLIGHDDGELRLFRGPRDMPPPLPHLMLAHRYAVHDDGRDALHALDSPTWDPRETVILESEPHPAPVVASEGGTVALREYSSDSLTIDADLPSPALLLVTDAYSRGWRARGLRDGVQQTYDVLPANRVLRAIPLAAGRHHLRMDFSPAHFRAGVALTSLSLAVLAVVFGWGLIRTTRRRAARA